MKNARLYIYSQMSFTIVEAFMVSYYENVNALLICLYIPLISLWTPEPICIKFGIYVMEAEQIQSPKRCVLMSQTYR
jgi:hypothetical protein